MRCLSTILVVLSAAGWLSSRAATVLVEAESFPSLGGWVVDTQFIEIMGSPYLMAHGLGKPVNDAETALTLPQTGTYRIWVRTKDWVARWGAPGTPGRFQLLVNGQPLPVTFGTEGAEWHWQAGGEVRFTQREIKLALRDLTGFNGRCDAILLSDDPHFVPPHDSTPAASWRRRWSGLPEKPRDAGEFDLVVVGGGYAGTAAAVSAARMGCKVALIQNRPVLGGNGSSEIRVWAQGKTRRGLFPRLGEIVEEFMDQAKASPGTAEEFADDRKEAVVRAEKNIQLFLNTHALGVEKNGQRILAVVALDVRTGELRRFQGRLFADCSGHATLGRMSGADHTVRETDHLGMSNMWRWRTNQTATPFPPVPWALDLSMNDFPYPRNGRGEWFWETGFNRHPLHDLEYMRDWNLRAVFGAFHAMKNKEGREAHLNAELEWVAYIGGTRESVQLLGDVILTRDDIVEKRPFPDGCVPTTWDIDLHYPREEYAKKYPQDPFISRAVFDQSVDREHGYPVPYRCLYSRNMENLFMAGRNVSVTHEALGTVRVMKTGGMMGEVVGKAASICLKHDCTPRDVFERYLTELKTLCHLPGATRRATVHAPLQIPPNPPPLPAPVPPEGIDPKTLPGLVIDDAQAKFSGTWSEKGSLKGYIGSGYRYATAGSKAVARFEFQVPQDGRYEVRLAHQPHENRAKNTPVTVFCAEGEKQVEVNQQAAPLLPHGFVSLGIFRFSTGKVWAVEIRAAGANGYVHADAVQVLPAP
ncbi:FAD-dependent oxidoreductase [Fontisphaera persica]|uniref:FAD-dependent oxidoreductase n=1 Tax=Fontisphaera persica TaxID=2974023 RepID=UPI0024C084C5|nr:FAD-dependent oxidoreductase [Fontisphaera persica]WCJ60454.1 FAD-dependent oxidoreductase [Fontisphaera persica]